MLALRSLLAAHTGYVFLMLPVFVVALRGTVSAPELPVRREKQALWDF